MKIYDYPRERRALERAFSRTGTADSKVEQAVSGIIQEVRAGGDAAVAALTQKFDGAGARGRVMRASPATCKRAWQKLPGEVKDALEFAKRAIEQFHRKQLRTGFTMAKPGIRLEQRVRPLGRVGVYVPGGQAVYPSTMLMNVIPAQVAGVREIIAATPPPRGAAEDAIAFAVAHLLGISGSVYLMGGAQAVAAMAFGTKTISKVDKVVGPGNAYVATAKRLLYGVIDIDSVAGESEVLIIADRTARPAYVASDLLAQAEHTGGESVVLVGIGAAFDFAAIERELGAQLARAPRRAQAERSLLDGGIFVRVGSEKDAVEIANLKAPEHMEIMTRNPEAIADKVANVGAIFLGPFTPESVGDYVAGPNHVLPTGGTARFFSPLGVDAFLKASNVLKYDQAALRKASQHVITLAESEGLYAHAEAVRVRVEQAVLAKKGTKR